MCGIFGWRGGVDADVAARMGRRLVHRGPDAHGSWRDPEADIVLEHRRLSILDPSEAGAQPMVSRSGRYVVCYNGEIFNAADLSHDLRALGHRFEGHGDTEILLAAIEQWGIRGALDRFIGFFAFGVWDRETRVTTVARDRMGVKPLYWAQDGHRFAFASELRALEGLDWIDRRIDPDALTCYFRYLCVSAPASILRGVRQLSPGTMLHFDGESVRSERWWSVDEAVERGAADPFTGDLEEATDALEALLKDAIRRRMVADVPVGAFLSGGIDSAVIVALMREIDPGTTAFTVGFEESSHDESDRAAALARHLGVDHVVARLTEGDVLAQVRRIAGLHDEPFADVSSVPTHMLCAMARERVTVALSGDGGDELFGGYPRYFWAARIARLRARLGPLAPVAGAVLGAIPAGALDGPVDALTGGRYGGAAGLSSRVHRFGAYLATPREDVYRRIVSTWAAPGAILSPEIVAEARTPVGPDPARFAHLDWAAQMMAVDQVSYLPDDILTKVDRMSMSVGLEVRTPMLDHRVVEFAWRLPLSMKLSDTGDRGKLILRNILARRVPPGMIDGPKRGFGIPLDLWLRGALRPWAADVLAGAGADGMLDGAEVDRLWKEHRGGRNHASRLWTILMYLEWRNARGIQRDYPT